MGPLWLDVDGYELDAIDKEILAHPNVGGVILFSRNYHDSEQLDALTTAMRKAAKKPILIGVDQEGGRVQRFRDGFTRLPAAQAFAAFGEKGHEYAKTCGWMMAAELNSHDIDLSFAPVLDLGHQSQAIGDRAFGHDVQTIIRHAGAFMQGMKDVGMATTGKHFPGHGAVTADSHLETPVDARSNIDLDIQIFRHFIDAGQLDAMMPAHVIYQHFANEPASGSPYWLKQILREKLGFDGIIFSDDLNMEGAAILGNHAERCQHALSAGCDLVLLCNNRKGVEAALDRLPVGLQAPAATFAMRNEKKGSLKALQNSQTWQDAATKVRKISDWWQENQAQIRQNQSETGAQHM
ncbi:Beta-hexosaminidase [Vibrio stylophorae]|uniref:Beta-hexosaminidase n=1 Tax=Vibrio stylophorae TaxID=659351 RepID=A0ABM8ZT39_9VIBR|nr:beta-N-acetylhexosaminidase [Vibrio stylophorae]CAH0533484.1 Beta-hexosaminidase [Vibrio stylophorae]